MIRHGADPKEAEIVPGKDFLIGKFVDMEKPTYLKMYQAKVAQLRDGGSVMGNLSSEACRWTAGPSFPHSSTV